MKIDISHTAKLARLSLSKREKEIFGKQLNKVLTYIEKLNEVNTNNVEPTSQVTGLENVTREDKILSSLSQKELLMNTKKKHNGFFKVETILNKD